MNSKRICHAGIAIVLIGWLAMPLHGQGTWQWSGRTHPELEWHTLTTENFNIHYHEGIDSIAHEGAIIAERVLPVLLRQLNISSIPKIDITYTAEDEIANGYALFSNMVFIWVDQNDIAVWMEDGKWLYQVTAHELQHVVLFHAIRSWMPEPFGMLLSHIPGWFVEGAAEYYTETWRPHRADLSHKWHILQQTESEMDPHHDGFSKLLYLSDRYGDSTLVKIVEYRNSLKLFNFNQAFEKATGFTVKQFNEDWRRHMNTYYYGYRAQKELIRELGKTFTLPLYSLRSIALSSDSLKIAASGRGSKEQLDQSLFLLTGEYGPKKRFLHGIINRNKTDLITKRKKRSVRWEKKELDHGTFHSGMEWSPDGASIAYAKYHYGKHQSLVWDIRIVDIETGKARWLTRSMRATYPTWTPDGKHLVFVAHQNNISNLYRITSNGKKLEQLTHFENDTQVLNPRCSPDGTNVAYSKAGMEGNLDVYIYSFATGLSNRITDDPAVDYLPVWHPDGKHITYTSHKGSTPNLYTVEIGSEGSQQVTDVGDAVWSSQWSKKDSTVLSTTLSDVDSVRLVRIDPFRTPDTKPLSLRKQFTAWRTHIPSEPLTGIDTSKKILILADQPYQFTRHIKHLTSFVLPTTVFEGFSIWSDAMGRHLFQAYWSTDWFFEYPSFAISYINAMSGPLWGIDYSHLLDFQYQTYDNKPLFEVRNGFQIWMLHLFNRGNSMSSNHRLLTGIRFHNRLPLHFEQVSSLPNPDAGREGLLSISYYWINRRPHMLNSEIPQNGTGLNISFSTANNEVFGDFSYSRIETDVFANVPAVFGVLFLRSRFQGITGSSIPPQEIMGLTNDWVLYMPGPIGAIFGHETMNPRGWNGIRLGDRAYMSTIEFRFPLIATFPVVKVLGISTGRITGTFFADIANAWSTTVTSPIRTAGYEARISLTIGKAPVIILSYGTGQLIRDWGGNRTPENYLRFSLINPF